MIPKYTDVIKAGSHYTTTYRRACLHRNGWYITVKFWIFTKRLFVCSDCGNYTET